MGGVRADVTMAYDTLSTYTTLFKDGARKQKRRIERRISNGTRPFQLNMTIHVLRQIARADRFARVLTRAIAHVKRKGLCMCHAKIL